MQPSSCFAALAQLGDALTNVFVAAVYNLALQAVLSQIGENFHRCCQRIALSGGEKIERLAALRAQFGQELEEDVFRSARAYIYKIERCTAIIGVVASVKRVFDMEVTQKFFRHGSHRLLVVQLGSECKNGDMIHSHS